MVKDFKGLTNALARKKTEARDVRGLEPGLKSGVRVWGGQHVSKYN